MALEHFTLGESRQLREDLVTLSIDRALFAVDPVPRSKAAWEPLKLAAAERLNDVGSATAALALSILDQYHFVSLALDKATLSSVLRTIPAFADIPRSEVYFAETHDRYGPLGAKPVGEAPIIPVAPAMGNALANATGIRFQSLPLSADRIFSRLAELEKDASAP